MGGLQLGLIPKRIDNKNNKKEFYYNNVNLS